MKRKELSDNILAYTGGDPATVELGTDSGSWIHVSDPTDPERDLFVKVSDPLMSYFIETDSSTRAAISKEFIRVCR